MAREDHDLDWTFDFMKGRGKTKEELARRTDPHTSHEAAEKIVPKLTKLRQKVYDRLRQAKFGMTDYELETWFGEHNSTYRTRRSELTEMGLVEDTGETRIIKGRARKVWRAK